MKKIIRLTESDLTRIVRRVIKEQGVRTSRQYLKEDQSKINPIQQYVNSAVLEMNKLIGDTAKSKNIALPTIKIKNSPTQQTVTSAEGQTTKVNVDNYYFELIGAREGSNAPTNINFNNITDPSRYGIFQKEWLGSLSNQNWLMNIDRTLVTGLVNISNKYLDSSKQLLGVKTPTKP